MRSGTALHGPSVQHEVARSAWKNAHGRLMGKLNNTYLVFCNRKTEKQVQ